MTRCRVVAETHLYPEAGMANLISLPTTRARQAFAVAIYEMTGDLLPLLSIKVTDGEGGELDCAFLDMKGTFIASPNGVGGHLFLEDGQLFRYVADARGMYNRIKAAR